MSYMGRYAGRHAGRWLGAISIAQIAKLALSASFRAVAALLGSFATAPIALRASFKATTQAVGVFTLDSILAGGAARLRSFNADFASRKTLAASHNSSVALAGVFVEQVPLAISHDARAAVSGTFEQATALEGTAAEIKSIIGTARGAP